jgi:hypothetical protein
MPNIQFADLIPHYALHWTTILHYLALLGVIAILTTSGDKSSVLFTLVLAALALLIGASLYTHLLGISRVFIFLIRVLIFGIPVVIAGMAPNEQARAFGVAVAILGLPLLILVFFTCWIGQPIGDPRLWGWC